MTDETKGDGMTLEQVRDELRQAEQNDGGFASEWYGRLADAIDAHLSRLMTVSDESVRISVNARDDAWNSESTEETLMHAALESFSMYQLGQLPNISKESHLAAQSAMRVDDTGDVEDMVSKALRRAWQLGQTYWQQADSESWSQNKKADETQAKFDKLVDETRAALQAAIGGKE